MSSFLSTIGISIIVWIGWMVLSKVFSLITGWPFELSINLTGVILVIIVLIYIWKN